jgi:hypothetical protein
MNGHIQLSISLKNYNEIQSAIDLLQSLLPQASLKPIPTFEQWEKDIALKPISASRGDLVVKTAKPKMLPNDKIIENLLKGVPKQVGPNWKKIDADIKAGKRKEKQRVAALKRKRDTHGHFLKDVKKK